MLVLGAKGRGVGAGVAAVVLLVGSTSACAGPTTPPGRATGAAGRSVLGDRADASPTGGDEPAALAASSPTGAATASALPGVDDEAEAATPVFAPGPRSAPASGPGTALLRDVRVGQHPPGPGTVGYERIVLELSGRARPGYRVRWLEDADGGGAAADGAPEVAGAARLEVVVTPASGVDLSDGSLAYDGPDRVPVADHTTVIRDLVRTGDYDGVLTWVVGTAAPVPFRVLTLDGPSRLVIDLQTG